MNENENLQENNLDPNTAEGPKQQQEETLDENKDKSTSNETFTQEQVNDIVRNRLDKMQNRIFNRYGVKDKNELDDLIGKSQSYNILKERLQNSKNENYQLREELAFIKNNINPSKYDDIRAYFKGKELEFTNDNLVNELLTHNEWLNPVKVNDKPVTTIKTLGNIRQDTTPEIDEKNIAAKLFGLKKIY